MIQDNWLNTVTLGTYKFTLYIVDSDVFNDPLSIQKNDDAALQQGKACIIAESGVTNSYAMENVTIVTNAASPTHGYANVTQITFDLLEPLGFSLLDRLLTVGEQLGKGTANGVNLASMLFIIKLDFLGRDPITGASVQYPEPFVYRGKFGAMTGSLGEAGAQYFVDFHPQDYDVLQETVTRTDVTVPNVTTVKTFAENLETALNQNQKEIEDTNADAADPRGESNTPNTKPLIEWKIKLDPSLTIAAQDIYQLERFDLANAPWGGTSDSTTAGGQSEDLDELGSRLVTINNETQLTAKIKELIAANTPTFANYSRRAKESAGHSWSIESNLEEEMLNEMSNEFNVEKKRVTIVIKLKKHMDQPPLNPSSLRAMRNSRRIQEQRVDDILPTLYKKYSYQYTGENSEVINIDLNLTSLFFNARSPMAGIYYADNSNLFEPNLTPLEVNPESNNQSSNPTATAPGASVRYLSDLEIPKVNLLQSPVYQPMPLGSAAQQVNETTTEDKLASAAMNEYNNRLVDAQMLSLEVRGDPIFLGQNGKSIFEADSQAAYVAFINFQPNADDLIERQQRGPVDMITTGLYKLAMIESRFQQGRFTQRLNDMIRDTTINTFLVLDKLIELEIE